MKLHAISLLARSEAFPSLLELVLEGRISAASLRAQALLDDQEAVPAAAAAELTSICGDLMLAQDHAEEAEVFYKLAVRLAGVGPKGSMRLASKRNTGLMCLYQRRFGIAASCFRDIVNDAETTPHPKVEALCGLALAEYGLGLSSLSSQAIDAAAAVAAQAGSDSLALMVHLIRCDVLVRREIRSLDPLRDHVFWHQSETSTGPTIGRLPLLGVLADVQLEFGQHKLAERCLQHLSDLVHAADNDERAFACLLPHLGWMRHVGMYADERDARIECTLVAIATGRTNLARTILEPLHNRSPESSRQSWSIELLYCLAKVSFLSGMSDESLEHYQRYALESILCARSASTNTPLADQREAVAGAPATDGTEMSLPARYRRAYRYILKNLACPALSVREIADDIGVTVRALQSAFKTHLGMTPNEVIQRARVVRIRADIIQAGGTAETIMKTGARWGIGNRSTLTATYRKYFHETPTDTLARHSDQAHPDSVLLLVP